jgi:hypothetical protein
MILGPSPEFWQRHHPLYEDYQFISWRRETQRQLCCFHRADGEAGVE